jgi:hypothetical protein
LDFLFEKSGSHPVAFGAHGAVGEVVAEGLEDGEGVHDEVVRIRICRMGEFSEFSVPAASLNEDAAIAPGQGIRLTQRPLTGYRVYTNIILAGVILSLPS